MLGIPPTIGFIGRWRLYETAVVIGWPLGTIFILSSIMALVAYVLALTRIWWGPESDTGSAPNEDSQTKEPFLLKTTIVLLVALIMVAGIWPSLLEMLPWGRL
jgi:NADH:ubiquinone oxidoreductase subunit 2 (subunit N)